MFGRATITLGIGPHSSLLLCGTEPSAGSSRPTLLIVALCVVVVVVFVVTVLTAFVLARRCRNNEKPVRRTFPAFYATTYLLVSLDADEHKRLSVDGCLLLIGLYIIVVRHVGIGINLVEILGNARADRVCIGARGGVWERYSSDREGSGKDLGPLWKK